MLPLFSGIVQSGASRYNEIWQNHLVTRLNRMSLMGIVNMIIGVIFFYSFGYEQFVPECAVSILVFIGIILCNRYLGFLWGIYLFYLLGFVFLMDFSLRMGKDSYLILFYFPVIISMVQLLGRKETMNHLIILSFFWLLSITVVAISYFKVTPVNSPSSDDHSFLALLNIILSFSTTVIFTLIVVKDFLKQERVIKETLHEKDILLAEVFHRVKNNLNVVTSLLNLQKMSSDSPEVHEALEECRSRVFSMALVHENLINHKDIGLDFKSYINTLINDIQRTLGVNGETRISIDIENVITDLEKAVPSGMILNELITNAHKYARREDVPLEISITLKHEGEKALLCVRDNGPGLKDLSAPSGDSLGFVLINSLCDQINGQCKFENDNGLKFSMTF